MISSLGFVFAIDNPIRLSSMSYRTATSYPSIAQSKKSFELYVCFAYTFYEMCGLNAWRVRKFGSPQFLQCHHGLRFNIFAFVWFGWVSCGLLFVNYI
jgi:hypothetical protein